MCPILFTLKSWLASFCVRVWVCMCNCVRTPSLPSWEKGNNDVSSSFKNILPWQNKKLVSFWQSSKFWEGGEIFGNISNPGHHRPRSLMTWKIFSVCSWSLLVLCIWLFQDTHARMYTHHTRTHICTHTCVHMGTHMLSQATSTQVGGRKHAIWGQESGSVCKLVDRHPKHMLAMKPWLLVLFPGLFLPFCAKILGHGPSLNISLFQGLAVKIPPIFW